MQTQVCIYTNLFSRHAISPACAGHLCRAGHQYWNSHQILVPLHTGGLCLARCGTAHSMSYLQVFIYRLCELSPYPAIRYAFNVSVCFWFCASSLTKSSCVCSVVYFVFFMACTVLLFKSVRPNAFYLFCVLLMFLTALSEECMACFTFRHLD